MTPASLLIAKSAASITGVAVVGGTSYVAVQHSTAIQKFFSTSKGTTTESTDDVKTSDESKVTEAEKNEVKDTTKTVEVKQTHTTITKDSTTYVYMLAKFSSNGQDVETDLFASGTNDQEYICQFEKSTSELVKNTACKIYKLAATGSSTTTINLKDSDLSSSSSEIKEKTNLTDGTEYLLKLSDSFVTDLNGASKTEIKILHKTATEKNNFGTFTKSVDLSQDKQKVNVDVAQSNLFSVSLTKAVTAGNIPADKAYKCKIGNSDAIECKIYKLSDAYASDAKTSLDSSVSDTITADDLAINKNVLVELKTGQKQLSELDGKIIILQNANSNTVVTEGLAESLLVGVANPTAEVQSNLFIVSDSYPTLTAQTVTDATKVHILTKGGTKNPLPKNPTYSKDDYLCRVIEAGKSYDDETCKFYEFPKTAVTSFDFADYKTNSANEIATIDKLGSEKYQVVELTKGLKDALKKPGSKLHLVKKDSKTNTINNKLVTLTREADLADSAEETTKLKTNLFLVMYTGTEPSTVESLTQNETLTCEEGSSSLGVCKIYKFGENVKIDNTLTTDEVASLIEVTSPKESFKANSYLAIELATSRKGLDDLKNKTITLKQNTAPLGTFAFDQIIMGKAGKAGLPDKPTHVSYIVKKIVGWTDATNATSYRCKLSGTSEGSKTDNYDSDCQLISIAPTADSKIMGFAELKAPETKLNASELNSKTENYYKLKVNSKLLNNLSFDENTKAAVQVELIKETGTSMGTFEITQKLDNNAFIGNTDLLLAQVKTTEAAANGTLDAAKCSFDSTQSIDSSTAFTCSLYKGTPAQGDNTLLKTTFASTSISATDSFAAKDYYLIDLTEAQKISALTSKDKIFYQIPNTTEGDSSTHKNIELTILGLMSGDFKNVQQPMFITQPKTPQQ